MTKKSIEWTTSDGSQVIINVELVTEKTVNADGVKVVVPCCEIEIEATLNGKYIGNVLSTYGIPENYRKMGVVAYIGKLGITEDNYRKIEKAITEIKSTPEWIAKEERIAKNKKENAEYDAHIARMNKVMGE
jgi:hypothetical protein